MTTDRFSTDVLETSERLPFWNRLCIATYSQVVITAQPNTSFGGALLRRSYNGVEVTQVMTSPAIVRGDSWGTPRHDPEYAVIMLQETGSSDVVLDGRRLALPAGALVVHPTSRPYSVTFDRPATNLTVKLPVDQLLARTGDPAQVLVMRARARDAALLAGFLRTLVVQDDPADEPGWHEAVSDAIFSLVTLTYRRAVALPARYTTVNERWQRRVRDFVEQHLDDPELGAAMIGHRLGASPRHVQKVFARMGTTASAYVIARRLDLAAQLLASSKASVTDVVFRVGFADVSYFYRCFRGRFGITPKRYAAQGREPASSASAVIQV